MSWNRNDPFGKEKKKEKKKKWTDEELVDGTYYEEFMQDWNEIRNRHEGQQKVIDAFFEDQSQYIFNKAGRKFAKTTTDIDIAWRYAAEKPNRVIYFCYPTIALGIEVLWEEKRLQQCDLRDDKMLKYVEKTDDNKHMIRFENGSYMKLIGTWTESRGRGTQPDLLIVDEIQDCSGEYLDAMDPNLAAKDGRCVMSGTPPKTRNHWYEWWDRIQDNSRGKTFHFTSYDNKSLPHLEEWLDRKKLEMIRAGKEDVWLREYMAEDCFASADRVLPDALFMNHSEVEATMRGFDYSERVPVLAIGMQGKYLCAVLAIVIRKKAIFIVDCEMYSQIWNKSFQEIFPELAEKCKVVREECGRKIRNLLWDPTKSFVDVIPGFVECRKDLKWQDRGIPLLREMMLMEKIFFSERIGDFGLECQNLLKDETTKDIEKTYPHICTLSMLVNEFFSLEKKLLPTHEEFDKYQGLREMGLPVPNKKKGQSIYKIGI